MGGGWGGQWVLLDTRERSVCFQHSAMCDFRVLRMHACSYCLLHALCYMYSTIFIYIPYW